VVLPMSTLPLETGSDALPTLLSTYVHGVPCTAKDLSGFIFIFWFVSVTE
jgi:hypothetical protein